MVAYLNAIKKSMDETSAIAYVSFDTLVEVASSHARVWALQKFIMIVMSQKQGASRRRIG